MTEHKEVVAYKIWWEGMEWLYTADKEDLEMAISKGFEIYKLGIIEPNTITLPTAEYEQLKADAERYRALKSNIGYKVSDYEGIGNFNVYLKKGIDLEVFMYGDLLDEAIDKG